MKPVSLLDLPEVRLDAISSDNLENQTVNRNRVQNYRAQGPVLEVRSRVTDRFRSSSLADLNCTRDPLRRTEYEQRSSDISWRGRFHGPSRGNRGNISSIAAQSRASRSNLAHSSYPRSQSGQRSTYMEKERINNWQNRMPKTDTKFGEFKFDVNGSESYRVGQFNNRDEYHEYYRPEKPNRELLIGYKYLKGLSEKEPHEMICEILRPNANISVVLNRKELQADWIMLITETLRKLCESDFKGNRVQILQYFCESPLMEHVSRYLGEVGMEKDEVTKKNLNSFVSNLLVFYSAVINTVPTVAVDKNFDKFLSKTKIGIDQMKMYLHIEIDEAIIEKLANLEKILEDETNIRDRKTEKPRRKYLDLVGDLPPPDDFRELSLYPTEEDINRHDFGFVRPNKIKGSYDDVNHYLDVQFRLIREDFIDPLRRGLKQYKNSIAIQSKPKYKYESVRFYPDTLIENVEITAGNKIAYVVNFDVNKRLSKVKWEYSKWFMYGSLLVFTRDNFHSFFFATVENRNLEMLNQGYILVTLLGSDSEHPLHLDEGFLKEPFLMAESEIYFDPYNLVMKALKDYNENDFPMKQFIVDGNTTVDFPPYVKKWEIFSIYDNSVNLVQNVGWPHHSAIGFDEHQFNAFKTALTSNFTIIQGPPGTGKTYLGLKIVEVLLQNIELNHDTSITPILLVCYTNHALDQFLEGILQFTKRIVRVGGQSRSDMLKEFNLRSKENMNTLRIEARKLNPLIKDCRDEMRNISRRLQTMNEEKKVIDNPTGILSYHVLIDVMNADFKRMIKDESTFVQWLLGEGTYNQNFRSIIDRYSKKKVTRTVTGVNLDQTKSWFAYDEQDERMKEDVMIDEFEEICPQKINVEDMFVRNCVSMQYVKISIMELQQALDDLEKKERNRAFDDYSEYHNRKHQLIERLRMAELHSQILDYHLQHAELELDSSTRINKRNQSFWKMTIPQRWSIYWNLVSEFRKKFMKRMKQLEADHRLKFQQYEELKEIEDFHVLKNASVVGMTTTCAARLQLLLKTLGPAIVIVEEAAEVLESHIVVSLSKKCQQVILIGDHKQLKPSTAVYELSKKYNISVSLFERMINNNMYCPRLQIQHRMRPEISSLIVPSIYTDLENHESVFKYPSVKGITKNLFFVEHNVNEETVEDSSSRKNMFEAEFMIELCRYILLQGYAADQITILTTYSGQMFLLKQMKHDHAIMKNVKVTVVDKYQGEENDIILLSLVRSNEERKIGFLSIENRVCVALSRAKIGLYIIGNMDILSDSNLWKNIKEELIRQEAIGTQLPLYCDKHDVHTRVSCKSDFNNVLEGGCHNFCNHVMDCGHKCPLLCHTTDVEHKEKKCREKCLRRCDLNHPCTNYCYEECGKCIVPVERTLPCGHVITLECFEDIQKYQCQVEISVILERCSHEATKKCFQSVDEVKCVFPCKDRLECGHQCTKNCHKTDDPNHLKYKCHKPCDRINHGCSLQHKCEKLCHEDCGKCQVRVEFTLGCSHPVTLPCSTNLDKINCHHPCAKKCPECNVKCLKKCFEDCKPCRNEVKKRIPDCGHEMKIECSVLPERKLCNKKCERIAPCGHECKSFCRKPCDTVRCWKIVKSTCVQALCGHGYADVQCWRKDEEVNAEELLPYCTEPCMELLKCGDLCAGTCGSCVQGRLHQMCNKKCGNVLVCEHSCSYPCRNLCPPCVKECEYSCRHSKCPNKCGAPCVHCREKCGWKCSHYKCTRKCGEICNRPPCYEPCPKKLRCKHDCIGFCGEPCPKKCRICDEEEVTTIIFGNEDEKGARFVLLVDCGHIIESEAMDRYIDMPSENGEIKMKLCPLCKTPISKTLRYMNQVKQVYRDIQNIKWKIYGNGGEIQQIREDLTQKLMNLDLKHGLLRNKELISISNTVKAFRSKLFARGRQSHLSNSALKTMNFFTDMFTSITSRLDDVKKCTEIEKSRILGSVDFLLKHVNPERLANVQQVEDTNRELNRYHRMVDYGVYLNQPGYLSNRTSPNVMSISADISSILYGRNRFDNEQDSQVGELFEKLQQETKSYQPVSQEEKRMIHAAMAKDFHGGVNSRGHWFTCTNGHYYCIADCGGAMQEAKCPECSELIGGRNHRYVRSARLASDMDGATRPAWSSGFYGGNFNHYR